MLKAAIHLATQSQRHKKTDIYLDQTEKRKQKQLNEAALNPVAKSQIKNKYCLSQLLSYYMLLLALEIKH